MPLVRVVALTTLSLLLSPGHGRAQPSAPDVIFHNATIITVNAAFDVAQAVAVANGTIVAVGSNDEIRRLAGRETRLVDLGGKTVVPGFYDNHIHLDGALQPWRGGMIDELPDWVRGADTLDTLVKALSERVAKLPKGTWVRGAIAREDWPNQKLPTRWDLDEVSPDHPVVLARGPHTLVVNSAALAAAGIDRTTADPPGGEIVHNDEGEPTGKIFEAARRLITSKMPPEEAPGGEEATIANWRGELKQLASLGISSVNVAGLRPNMLKLAQTLYERHGAELPRMTVQLRLSPGYDTHDDPEIGVKQSIAELESLGFRTGFGNDRLKIGAVKMSIDGGMSAPVFWSTTEYTGRAGFYGEQRIPDSVFYRVAKRAHELGWQLGIHTMGDAAVVMVVNELEKILGERPRADHRHYLHHVAVKPPAATLETMARLGIMVASQPAFTIGLGAYAQEALSREREATQNPSRSLLAKGIRVSYGSDAAPYGPMFAIYAAVTRKGWDGQVRGAGEAVTVQEALRFHTIESAYFTFDERHRGSIEPGKAADLAVLAEDPLSAPANRLGDIKVDRTVVAGRDIFVR